MIDFIQHILGMCPDHDAHFSIVTVLCDNALVKSIKLWLASILAKLR
jgi:hypothetical protein